MTIGTETNHVAIGGILISVGEIDIAVGGIDRNAVGCGERGTVGDKLLLHNLPDCCVNRLCFALAIMVVSVAQEIQKIREVCCMVDTCHVLWHYTVLDIHWWY